MGSDIDVKEDKRARSRFGAFLGRAVAIVSAVGVVLGAAVKYVELRSTCAPHPFWQCILGNPEEDAKKEWDSRISRSVAKKEIELFVKRFPNSRMAGPATARLSAVEEWDGISARPVASLVRRFIERHDDPVLTEFARAELSRLERLDWKQAVGDGSRTALTSYLETWPNGSNAVQARERIRRFSDDDAWQAAKRVDSIAAYEAYSARFPEGNQIGAARTRLAELREDVDWDAARAEGTVSALRDFVRRWPRGHHKGSVEQYLVDHEEQAWARVVRDPVIASLRQYLNDWPKGRHAAKALARITEHDDKAWEQALTQKSLAAIQTYLAEFPTGRHRATATGLAVEIRDGDTWKLAAAANTAEAYKQYLELFPSGLHAFDARSRLAVLTDEMLWARAKSIGTLQALMRFRREQTTGRHLTELDQLLATLDETAWQRAISLRNAEGFRAYLHEWGEGRHAADAQARLTELRQPEECDRLAGNPDDPNVKGPGVPYSALDPQAAIAACSKAIVLVPGEARLKYQLARAHQKAGQWSLAHQLHSELASAGYVAAMDNLGWLFANGQGVQKNPRVAERYFRQAAARNHAESMFSLFLLLQRINADEAQRWLQRAADRGYQPAVARLQAGVPQQATPEDIGKGIKQIGPIIQDFKGIIDGLRPPRR